MDIKKITENEKNILYKAADEYQKGGKIKQLCPHCQGQLKYMGNMSSYRIMCENNCGIIFNVRGI